ncbi:MAG TPA: methyltransferase domain-containing protein [Solirubrobacterales bacterium]|nr:methyltransferase domain-containing protein [Solirubrobacterales bacterium]
MSPQDDAYFEFDRPELRELVPATAGRVLDVGCGAGALGAALREERGIEVMGLELSKEAAAHAGERLDAVVEADLDQLEELPFERGSFDAMIFGDVLEHLRDPHRLLRLLRPWLADDGALVCSIPNVAHWSVVLPLLTQDRWPYADAGLLDRTHVHFFTVTEAELMLRECGFAVESAATTALPQAPPAAVDHLTRFLAALGAEETETGRRLNAYQYLLVARPVG